MLLTLVLLASLFTNGLSQSCFSEPNCGGSQVQLPSGILEPAKSCCVDTNDGQSYGMGSGDCELSQCIVHGFDNTSYSVDESRPLDASFRLYVKGEPVLDEVGIFGTITATPAGTAVRSDYSFQTIENVEDETDIGLIPVDDVLALEYDDSVNLTFISDDQAFIDFLEGLNPPEYVRTTATVDIIDDDVLRINYNVLEYRIGENGVLESNIALEYQETQNPFTLIFTPITIDAVEAAGLGNVIGSDTIDMLGRATEGPDADFSETVDTFVISPFTTSFTLPNILEVNDDNVNERDQVFGLLAEISDVPDRFTCFQIQAGQETCILDGPPSPDGVARIRIIDNDPMVIGFENRSQSVSEEDTPSGDDGFQIAVSLITERTSELDWEIVVFYVDSSQENAADVGPATDIGDELVDARYGSRVGGSIEETLLLAPGSSLIRPVPIFIVDDFLPEPTEFFNLSITFRPPTGIRQNARCDDDTGFFCDYVVFIEDDDDPFEVAFVRTTYTVPESVGSVEVCVNLTEPQVDIREEFVIVEVTDFPSSIYVPADVTLATPDVPFRGMYNMLPRTDFAQQLARDNAIDDETITELMRIVCYNQTIYEDNRVEGDEWMGLSLGVDRDTIVLTLVQPMYDQAAILIQDNDNAIVGLEQTFFNVSEDVGVVELCAIVISPVIDCPIEFPFDVQLSTFDGTAESPGDYISVDVTLMFPACGTRQCVNVTIVDDFLDEPDENFFYTLERTPGLHPNINLDPVDGEVVIRDNDDPIEVGYDPTFYVTTESEGMVELTIVVSSPAGGTPIPFILFVTTEDDTAESPEDYDAVIGELIQFNAGDTIKTHIVNISQDDICETFPENEQFFSNIALVDSTQPVTVTRPRATVVINDTLEPECAITVGYEFTEYITPEGSGTVELCAVITSHPVAPRPFTISATTRDGTAVAGEDYVAVVAEPLMFSVGEDRVCHSITILQDDDCEILRVEDFFSDLAYVSGVMPILINPPTARVIIDDTNEPECEITVGYERTVYTTPEGSGTVELCAVITSHPVAPRPFTISATTRDGTAVAGEDYVAIVAEPLVFPVGEDRVCHSITILQNDDCDTPEDFFSDLAYVTGVMPIIIDPPTARVIILEPPCGGDILVNDTLTGDPLMTVPIRYPEDIEESDPVISLCYEVHGEDGKYFNLISDSCVSVNAHYSKADTESDNIDINVVDQIGIRAVSLTRMCDDIRVDLSGCQAIVNGVPVNSYSRAGIRVRSYKNRVRIAVPNCEDTDLVMWVFCKNGSTEDPVTWVYYDFTFIRFVVTRGLNLNEESHGIMGQFWNVPVVIEEHDGLFHNQNLSNDYVITVQGRQFVGIRSSVTWEFEKRDCLYVGNSQAGPLGEEVEPNQSVIEGTYRDYEVASLFATEFIYSHFAFQCPP